MEIKTTLGIIKKGLGNEINAIELNPKCLSFKNEYLDKKWVSVDNLILYLEKLDPERYVDNMINKLKGDEK